MNESHPRAAFRYTLFFFAIVAIWAFVTDKLVSGSNPKIFHLWLHDWLLLIFIPALLFIMLYVLLRKNRMESDARLQAEAALRNSDERFRLAMAGANDGVYDWNPMTGYVYYSAQYKAMLGYRNNEFEFGFEDLKKLIHPDDLPQVMARVEDFLEGRSEKYETEYRMRHKDGHYVDILSRAFLVRGEDGSPTRVVGTHVDITARKRAEALYRSLFDNLQEACTYCRMVYDDDGKPVDFIYLDVNESFIQETGKTNPIGKRVTELFPHIVTFTPNIIEIAGGVARTGKSEKFESYIQAHDKWLSNSLYCPSAGYFIGIYEDITERKRNEEALRESEQRVRTKLDAILSPGGDIANLELTDILDIPALQLLMDHFFQIAGVPVALVDTAGKVLVGAGWQRICTDFHRVHPESSRHCTQSDLDLATGIPFGEYRGHKCKNNMFDIATPIRLGERQIASLYAGQFFYDDKYVDEDLFRAQAANYGFDEQVYMEALRAVPRLPRDRVVLAMEFFVELANMISQLSYNRITLARSLSERIMLMDSLREREEIYSAIVNQAADGIALIDIDTLRFVEFNDATCEAFGYTREEFAALSLPNLVPDETPAEVGARIYDVAKRGGTYFVGKRRHKDGRLLDMNISARVILLRGREYLSVIWRDVTEHRKAEEALRVSEQRFHDVSDAAGEFIWEFDTDGRLTYISDRVESILGFKPQEILGDIAFDHMIHSEALRFKALLAEPIARQFGFRDFEHCFTHKSGDPVWVSAAAVPMLAPGGDIIGFRGATLDITQRKKHEREIEQLNRLYATLSELNKTITHVHSREELFSEVCRISADIAGFQVVWIGLLDEHTGEVRPIASAGARLEYLSRVKVYADERPEGLGPVGRCLREGRPSIFNDFWNESRSAPWYEAAIAFDLKAAAALPIRLHGKIIGAYTVYSNETNVFQEKEVELLTEAASAICFALDNIEREEERQRLQAQLLQSQKMEAIGQLAGGVAHDFNNQLTVILGYSEMLLSKLADGDPSRSCVVDINDAGERAAALTRQLLAFSRKQLLAPKVLDMNTIVENLEKMLRRLIGEDIILMTGLAPDLKPVEVDPNQIEQVIVNLAVNARDAMPAGGRLFIETANCEIDDAYCNHHPGARPGQYVLIAITDNGAGMTEEVKARIFEPFFTTKEKGKGTGLGLATVFGTINQSGGYIDVISEPGVGSCFKIYLPALTGPDVAAGERMHAPAAAGSETILLVEDEDAVRHIAQLALESRGYRVIAAPGGPAALEIAGKPSNPIDLLVTDVVMPEMSGRELAEKIRGIRPGLKVLFMSGYTDDAILRLGLLGSNTAYLQKPFIPGVLAERVRRMLDA